MDPLERLGYQVYMLDSIIDLAMMGWSGTCKVGDTIEHVHARHLGHIPRVDAPTDQVERLLERDKEVHRLERLKADALTLLASRGIDILALHTR